MDIGYARVSTAKQRLVKMKTTIADLTAYR